MIYIGTEIRKILFERGLSVAWLSLQLSYSRANTYKILGKSSIDTHLLFRISKILNYDFFNVYSSQLPAGEDCRHIVSPRLKDI